MRELARDGNNIRAIAVQLSLDFGLQISPKAVRDKASRVSCEIRPQAFVNIDDPLSRKISHKELKGPAFWTPERDERLYSLLKEGKTYKDIAYLFGRDASSIRMRCLRLADISSDKRWISIVHERSEARKQTIREIHIRAKRPVLPTSKINHDLVFHNPNARKVGLMELKNDWCHFPTGDPKTPSFFYCGADVPEGHVSQYCEFCHPVVYAGMPAPKITVKRYR